MINRDLQKNSLLYQQARAKIEAGIASGFYRKGDRLPSERTLSGQLGVSMITMRRALEEMADDGILEKQWGRGVYVKKSLVPIVVPKKIALTVLHDRNNLVHPAVSDFMYGLGEAIENNRHVGLEIIFITKAMLENSDYSILSGKAIDGLIVTVLEIATEEIFRFKTYIPDIVAINRADFSPSVIFDYEDATLKILDYLYNMGHRRIAFIGGIEGTVISKAHEIGYKRFLKTGNIPFDKSLVRSGTYERSSGYALAKDILCSKNITAIIAGDDNIAAGVIDAVSDAGLNCPADISVCSFNDFPVASMTKPALTTVAVPFREMGRIAGKTLLEAMNGKIPEKKIKLEGELVIRGSVGKAKERMLK